MRVFSVTLLSFRANNNKVGTPCVEQLRCFSAGHCHHTASHESKLNKEDVLMRTYTETHQTKDQLKEKL